MTREETKRRRDAIAGAIMADLAAHPGSLASDMAKRIGMPHQKIASYLGNAKLAGLVHSMESEFIDKNRRKKLAWYLGDNGKEKEVQITEDDLAWMARGAEMRARRAERVSAWTAG